MQEETAHVDHLGKPKDGKGNKTFQRMKRSVEGTGGSLQVVVGKKRDSVPMELDESGVMKTKQKVQGLCCP
jgi:hypothetical protein